MKLVLLSLLIFCSASFAGPIPKALLAPKLVAPSVPGTGSVTNLQVGTIVYDAVANAFAGLDQTGTWQNLSPGKISASSIVNGYSLNFSCSTFSVPVPFTSANGVSGFDNDMLSNANAFTAQHTGYHIVSVSLMSVGSPSGDDLQLAYAVNGGAYSPIASVSVNGTDRILPTATTVLKLTAGDQVQFFCNGSNVDGITAQMAEMSAH